MQKILEKLGSGRKIVGLTEMCVKFEGENHNQADQR